MPRRLIQRITLSDLECPFHPHLALSLAWSFLFLSQVSITARGPYTNMQTLLFIVSIININPFNASCSKLLLFERFSTILV